MKLGQLNLFTGDAGRLVGFYRDTLGLPDLEREQGWCVRAGGIKLALHEIPKHIAGEVSDPPDQREDCYWKPTFVVDDLDAVLARRAVAGIAMSTPPTYGPRTFSDGMDPDGNVIKIPRYA